MPERRRYHHGNLRQALLDAAADLIRANGPAGFTLAEAARQAGVSAAAPYRHFAGREQLIDELAREGYAAFADRLSAAFDAGRPAPLTAMLRMVQAYLDFAREQPGHYIAMFESGLNLAASPDLSRAADQALAVMEGAARALGPETGLPPRVIANHIWALSHGVVELFDRGQPGQRLPFSAAEMLESGVLTYLRGLGLISD